MANNKLRAIQINVNVGIPPSELKQTASARAKHDPGFARALLDEAFALFLNGEPDTAKLILRDLVNATVGFEELATEVNKPIKSLHRMLSVSGNPTMGNLSAILAKLQKSMHVVVKVSVNAV